MKVETHMKKEKTIWLSYDLGIKGDYENLYIWLDRHNAKECGDSLAVFKYTTGEKNLLEALKKDLKKNVSIRKEDRIYIIFKEDGRLKGKFLFGKRKVAPWAGYAKSLEEADEDIEAI